MIKNWRFWFTVALSLLFLLLLVYQVDFADVGAALGQANYIYVVPVVALYFVAVYFRALRWRYLLSPLRVFPISRLYPVIVIGYLANNLLPVRLGELVRAYYLARRENFSSGPALATVGVERVYDGVTLMAFVAISAPLLLAMGWFDNAGAVTRTAWTVVMAGTGAAFLAALSVLTLLAVSNNATATLTRLVNFVPEKYGRVKILEFAETFLQGLRILSSPRKHLGLFLLSLPVWFGEAGVYFLVGYAFDLSQVFGPIWVLALVMALLTATSNLATAVPSAIGGIGPFEVVAQQTLLALGVGASVGAAYATFVHLVALWLPVNLVGLYILWSQNISWNQLTATGKVEALETAAETAAAPAASKDGPS